MKRVIAIYSSSMQSGKSTIAKVAEIRGYKRIKFADTLKDMLRILLRDLGVNNIEDRIEGSNRLDPLPLIEPVNTRQLMQWLGTEFGRDLVDEDLWVKIVKSKIERSLWHVVIDDLRFENEFLMLQGMGAEFIRVESGKPVDSPHRSEGNLNDYRFDYYYENTGTLEDLEEWSKKIL